ncbi:MarR family transcriptional regulator [Streptomyces sp. BH-SS-21]|uniref:MarR family transcriptional regulator n=1 Tax=Streptomyces liliiviolaceus TaxID=2823109 RepID=A0A940XRD7_9ACTN|nr:MarR family transcriptional regulator [Streptomyces liliiviolaceus]MBQ0848108.1 MarR family transcriptional regulator [Streptomyces liliiviolaceus]
MSGTDGAGEAGRERQDLFSRSALAVFRLNGQYLGVAEELAGPAGLTAARWQVLGAVLREPLPVSGIARAMGITRQSVQRIADLLVERGLAEYVPNPAHRRAKLLRPTGEGFEAVRKIGPGHAAFADRLTETLGERIGEKFGERIGKEIGESIGEEIGEEALAETVRVLERLIEAMETASEAGAGPAAEPVLPVTEP